MSPRTIPMLAVAMSAALGAATSAQAFDAAKQEKCYGVALKGQNDCAAAGVHACAGHSKADYDGASWKAVAKGTCLSMNVNGHKGSLEPIKG